MSPQLSLATSKASRTRQWTWETTWCCNRYLGEWTCSVGAGENDTSDPISEHSCGAQECTRPSSRFEESAFRRHPRLESQGFCSLSLLIHYPISGLCSYISDIFSGEDDRRGADKNSIRIECPQSQVQRFKEANIWTEGPNWSDGCETEEVKWSECQTHGKSFKNFPDSCV